MGDSQHKTQRPSSTLNQFRISTMSTLVSQPAKLTQLSSIRGSRKRWKWMSLYIFRYTYIMACLCDYIATETLSRNTVKGILISCIMKHPPHPQVTHTRPQLLFVAALIAASFLPSFSLACPVPSLLGKMLCRGLSNTVCCLESVSESGFGSVKEE